MWGGFHLGGWSPRACAGVGPTPTRTVNSERQYVCMRAHRCVQELESWLINGTHACPGKRSAAPPLGACSLAPTAHTTWEPDLKSEGHRGPETGVRSRVGSFSGTASRPCGD